MPGPKIVKGEGVVFAFVDTCPSESITPKSGNRFSDKVMLNQRQSATALESEMAVFLAKRNRRQERSSWPVLPV
jgi:hypothetical protein